MVRTVVMTITCMSISYCSFFYFLLSFILVIFSLLVYGTTAWRFQGNCVAVMTSILRQMSEMHYKLYLDQFETLIDLSDFLMEILTVIEELITSNVYPADWNEMILLQNW